jgi:biopolymer transport protein ExbB
MAPAAAPSALAATTVASITVPPAPAVAPAAAATSPPPTYAATAATEPAAAAAPEATAAAEPPPPPDVSAFGLFWQADHVVKAVMIGLIIASLVTWTVWLAKTLELRSARRAVRADLRTLMSSSTLAQAHEQLRNGTSAVAQLMQAAGAEIRASANLRGDGLKERIAWQLERLEMAGSRKIARGTGVLATIGSTAPFVGLFGAVWGIMDSFIGIANAHTTNLAVVAPGIAEALFATALGLVAAIPAVMIYNVLARGTAQYRALLGDGSAQVMKLVSRDLDRAKMPMSQAAE